MGHAVDEILDGGEDRRPRSASAASQASAASICVALPPCYIRVGFLMLSTS